MSYQSTVTTAVEPQHDYQGDAGIVDVTAPLLTKGQLRPQLSTTSVSSDDSGISSTTVHSPVASSSSLLMVPKDIQSVIISNNKGVVHIGSKASVSLNHIFVSPRNELDSEIMQSTLKSDIQRNVIDILDEMCQPDSQVGVEVNNGGLPLSGEKESHLSRWYYWIIILVALSGVACVLFAVVAAVNNKEFGVRSEWWYFLGAVVVSLSCINLVSTALFSLNRFFSMYNRSGGREAGNVLPENMPDAPRMIGRIVWGGQPPRGVIDDHLQAVERVVIIHTASEEYLTTPQISYHVRQIQMIHIEARGWCDIAYNFLIGGDGCVYVGRGWDKVGAFAKQKNERAIGVAIIGTFIDKLPNNDQLEALRKLIKWGVKIRKISENYKIVAHCQLQRTQSPGRKLVDHLYSWPNFDKSLLPDYGDLPSLNPQ